MGVLSLTDIADIHWDVFSFFLTDLPKGLG
jgi:hypothetical protein